MLMHPLVGPNHDLVRRDASAESLSLSVTKSVTAILGQYQLALVCAACEGVGQTLVHVRPPATSPFDRSGATGIFVPVCFEVRTFLPGLVYLVPPFKVASAGPGALPALVGHVLVLAYAVLNELR